MESPEPSAVDKRPQLELLELVIYDPDDLDTYPSVCQNAEDVRRRFGYEGGETLLFDALGKYIGQVDKQIGKEPHGKAH